VRLCDEKSLSLASSKHVKNTLPRRKTALFLDLPREQLTHYLKRSIHLRHFNLYFYFTVLRGERCARLSHCMKQFAMYILSSDTGTLYVGITNNLLLRVA